jgi:hypothetical protein
MVKDSVMATERERERAADQSTFVARDLAPLNLKCEDWRC